MKHHLRKEMQQKLAAMPASIAAAGSKKACDALVSLDEFRNASAVMIYLDIPNEVDTSHVAMAAWQEDKTVLVPKVTWEHKHITAVEIKSLETGLVQTPQGLREPQQGEPWPIEMIDFIVVPALAYDKRGHRLGRGGGFYDRFLATPGIHAVTCGLAFSLQVVDELPIHGNDYPVDILVTDEQVLRFDHKTKLQEK